jgi:hypothetical protein
LCQAGGCHWGIARMWTSGKHWWILQLGIFDKWQNHSFLFGIYLLVIMDFLFSLFFFFSFPQKEGVIFPIESRNHFFLKTKLNFDIIF